MPNTGNQPNKIVCAVSRLLWDTELIASRLVLSFAALFWGVLLLWPGEIFDRGVYHYLSLVMPKEMWGVVFLVSSYLQAHIVVTGNLNGRFSRSFAAWNALFWGGVVMSMLLSVYPPPAAIGGEVALAIAALWIWVRPYILAEGYKCVGYPQTCARNWAERNQRPALRSTGPCEG